GRPLRQKAASLVDGGLIALRLERQRQDAETGRLQLGGLAGDIAPATLNVGLLVEGFKKGCKRVHGYVTSKECFPERSLVHKPNAWLGIILRMNEERCGMK